MMIHHLLANYLCNSSWETGSITNDISEENQFMENFAEALKVRVGKRWYPGYPGYRGTFSKLQILRNILNKFT